MIVQHIMTTKLITVEADDTLGHACNLLRQHQFHHLPVVRSLTIKSTQHGYATRSTVHLFRGLLTSEDIEIAASKEDENASKALKQAWQDRRVVEVLNPDPFCVAPTACLGTAAKLLVERGINCLPVIEYIDESATDALLVGLLTRSDLLLALAHAMGADEPGMPLDIVLPEGDMTPLLTALQAALTLHVPIRGVMTFAQIGERPAIATMHVGTINPLPLLSQLREKKLLYRFADPLSSEVCSQAAPGK